jgi:chemotaxis protein MotA
VFIVLGGVIASTIVSYPLPVLKNLMKVAANAFMKRDIDMTKDVELIFSLAQKVRKENSLLALEETVSTMDDPFLKKGLMLVVDGSDPELVQNIMETDLAYLKERHAAGQAILLQMSSFSPAYGMIGTLIGLINLLAHLDDMDALGPNMAIALVTTFYGVILANLVFTPLAKKLKRQSEDEYLHKEILLEGILSIQSGENPRMIKEKLYSFLSNSTVRAAIAASEKAAGQETRE